MIKILSNRIFVSFTPTYASAHFSHRHRHHHHHHQLTGMAATGLKSDALMKQMKLHLATDVGKQIVHKIGLVYQINISPKELGLDEVTYVVDLKKGEVKKGDEYEGGKADVTFSFTDEDFLKVATGKMSPQMAFMRGAIKIKGSLSAAQKFTPDIFPKLSKM